jgi:hypothetical protein
MGQACVGGRLSLRRGYPYHSDDGISLRSLRFGSALDFGYVTVVDQTLTYQVLEDVLIPGVDEVAVPAWALLAGGVGCKRVGSRLCVRYEPLDVQGEPGNPDRMSIGARAARRGVGLVREVMRETVPVPASGKGMRPRILPVVPQRGASATTVG